MNRPRYRQAGFTHIALLAVLAIVFGGLSLLAWQMIGRQPATAPAAGTAASQTVPPARILAGSDVAQAAAALDTADTTVLDERRLDADLNALL